jgi:hypothetical protein
MVAMPFWRPIWCGPVARSGLWHIRHLAAVITRAKAVNLHHYRCRFSQTTQSAIGHERNPPKKAKEK